MTLSGPKDCRGSMKDARMRPHFLHSPGGREVVSAYEVWHEVGGIRSRSLRIDEGSGLLRKGGMVLTVCQWMMRYNQKCPGQDKKSAVGMDQ